MKEHPVYKGYIISCDGKVFSCLQRNGRNPATKENIKIVL
jgi:hypothetical protein